MNLHSLDPFERLRAVHGFPAKRPNRQVVIKGWRTWGSQFQELLQDRKKPVLLEIGSWFGKNLIERFTEIPDLRAIAVDTFEGGAEHQPGQVAHEPELAYLYEQFLANTWDFQSRLAVVRALSWDGMQIVADFGVQPDIVYIDAGHTHDMVSRDVETACRLFKYSIICGDDYDSCRPNAVKAFIDVFTSVNKIELKRFERFWWFPNPIGESKPIRSVFAPLHLRHLANRKLGWSTIPDSSVKVFTHALPTNRTFDIPTHFEIQDSDQGKAIETLTKDFTNHYTAPPVYTGVVQNALISPRAHALPRYWLVFGSTHYIADSSNDLAKENWMKEQEIICSGDIMAPTNETPECVSVKGQIVWFYNFKNLHHFMEETLPTLITVREIGIPLEKVTYLCGHLSDSQMEFLKMLGVPPSNTIEIDRKWIRCEELYWSCFPTLGHISNPTTYRAKAVDLARSAALKSSFHDDALTLPRKIFISRRRAVNRRLVNESAVTEVLRERGFVDVDPGSYSIAEQIRLFSEAEVVIGIHGMGVTNFIFSEKPRLLVEIMSTSWSRPYYFRQCQERGVPYAGYFIEPIEPEATVGIGSYLHCNISDFLRFLSRVSEATGVSI
ncbi:MAG: glycosyltransferase 61 family protein [Nitrososphaera sp.]|nr:glycosyltransferase 61 family protein [Nitrososphaera sp.]